MEKKKLSEKLTQKDLDDRSEVLNPQSPKYHKCRTKGLTEKQAEEKAKKMIKLNLKKKNE